MVFQLLLLQQEVKENSLLHLQCHQVLWLLFIHFCGPPFGLVITGLVAICLWVEPLQPWQVNKIVSDGHLIVIGHHFVLVGELTLVFPNLTVQVFYACVVFPWELD